MAVLLVKSIKLNVKFSDSERLTCVEWVLLTSHRGHNLMNFEKFTIKSQEALQKSAEIDPALNEHAPELASAQNSEFKILVKCFCHAAS